MNFTLPTGIWQTFALILKRQSVSLLITMPLVIFFTSPSVPSYIRLRLFTRSAQSVQAVRPVLPPTQMPHWSIKAVPLHTLLQSNVVQGLQTATVRLVTIMLSHPNRESSVSRYTPLCFLYLPPRKTL